MSDFSNPRTNRESTRPSLDESEMPIVGIGASAGGLEALQEFLENAPNDIGVAYVVVTHQLPDRTSLLPEIFGKRTMMPFVEAADGMKLQPDHVYVGPPGGQPSIPNCNLKPRTCRKPMVTCGTY